MTLSFELTITIRKVCATFPSHQQEHAVHIGRRTTIRITSGQNPAIKSAVRLDAAEYATEKLLLVCMGSAAEDALFNAQHVMTTN